MTAVLNKNSWGRFDFLGVAKYITIASVALTVLALILIASRGLNYGVDFAGGIEMQVQFNQGVDAGQVREFMAAEGFANANVQALGKDNEYLIHLETKGETDEEANTFITQTVEKVKTGLAAKFGQDGATVRRVDTVGPQVGAELKRNGILAGFYCLLLILIYVGLRFDYRYAPAAVFCLFHDAIITVGIYSLCGWEFTTQTLAAVLTIIGYSLNDTIVIFDRIRENIPIHRDKDLYWVSNRSINETLSRTILTYITTYLTVSSMFFFADGAIYEFARAMMIGMFLGAYSTIYVATPLMLVADYYQKNAAKKRSLQTA
ncbi:MAG TPA: protein translocase subunit SecF [Bdellovibrionales bacterium]|nr:protein translocase subunit SecF [Bdellovibrionales bacterium]